MSVGLRSDQLDELSRVIEEEEQARDSEIKPERRELAAPNESDVKQAKSQNDEKEKKDAERTGGNSDSAESP